MGAGFHIDKAGGVVYTSAWGSLTADDVLNVRRRLVTDPDFSPDLSQVVDLRRVETVAITGHEVSVLAVGDPFSEQARRALVGSEGVVFGVLRMYEAYVDKSGIRVCRNIEEALRWLGLDRGDE